MESRLNGRPIPASLTCLHAVLTLLSLLPCTTGCESGSYYNGRLRVARYADMSVYSQSARRPSDAKKEKFGELITDGRIKKLAALYVELPDRTRYLLSELPEAEVTEFFVKDKGWPGCLDQYYKCDDGINTTATFAFRDGKLVYARFDSSDSIPIPFSPTKEGPYYKMPIDREMLLKLFGEPREWGSRRVTSGP